MSNSPLVSYTKISPNKTSPRTHTIDTITIHCVVGQCSIETLGNIFAPRSKQASSNYGVGPDGRIGMYVEEKDRSWCSSNKDNDNRAITIEVASDTTHPYAVTDAAYKGLIKLLVDICQRNNIDGLRWKADKSLIGQPDKQNMTVHRWFANKACPGDYLYNLHSQIASEVNEILGYTEPIEDDKPTETPAEPSVETPVEAFEKGDIVTITKGATYYNGVKIPDWIFNKQWIVLDAEGDRVVIDKSADGQASIMSPINSKYLINKSVEDAKPAEDEKPSSDASNTEGYTKITSKTIATAKQMAAYIKKVNPNVAQSVIDMVPLYLSEGEMEGIAGDIAFAQSCLETGNFGFNGSAVTLDQNNFCGMGVTSNGMKGNSFKTPQLGIRAQIQHLKAYASTEPLVGECVDPRFKYVTRGCAPYVEWLGMRENPEGKGWASGVGYGEKILTIRKAISQMVVEVESEPKVDEVPTETDGLKEGDLVAIIGDARYYDGRAVPEWVKYKKWYVYDVTGDRVVINKSEDGVYAIMSPINSMYLTLGEGKSDVPYTVQIDISNLNIRKGPGTNYGTTGNFTGKGTFTIVEVSEGSGSRSGWGRLKSGAGWICLDHAKRV